MDVKASLARRARRKGGADDVRGQTGFFARVYALVACIPRGQVATYGQIA
ncbi:MAG: MGMT family protein, partial [candidate division NC10 bacterium]|nr:MGMT family protein [candidate division NC10 bacterium]